MLKNKALPRRIRLSLEVEKQVKNIVDKEFDLESLLRKREISTIESEIDRGSRILSSLREITQFQRSPAYDIAVAEQEAAILREEAYVASLGQRKRQRLVVENYVFARRKDGEFVRLTCPECAKTDFGSRAGFINHCRNAHSLSLPAFADCVERCGVPVDEELVPADDPCRWETNVGEFEHMDEIIIPERRHETEIKVFDGENGAFECNDVSGEQNVPSLHSVDSDEHDAAEASELQPQSGPMSGLTPLGLPSIHVQSEKMSRFYVKKRIIVGNISKFILPEKRKNPRNTHKWMVYVKDLNPNLREVNSVASYLKSVKFYLHPSYKPKDVVEVVAPPFQLVLNGWGEFPIRIRLNFWDENINKPIDIIHQLSFDKSFSCHSVQGPERLFDIELDRQTILRDYQVLETPSKDKAREYVEGSDSENELEDLPYVWTRKPPTPAPSRNASSLSLLRPSPPEPEKIDEKYHDGTYCKFCGSNVLAPRFDWAAEANRSEATSFHDPQRCQFRPATKKGKVRHTFTSISCVSSVLDQIEKLPEPEELALHEKPIVVRSEDWLKNPATIAKLLGVELEADPVSPQLSLSLLHRWPLKVAAVRFSSFRRSLKDSTSSSTVIRNESANSTALLYMFTKMFVKKLVKASLELCAEETKVELEDDDVMHKLGDLPIVPKVDTEASPKADAEGVALTPSEGMQDASKGSQPESSTFVTGTPSETSIDAAKPPSTTVSIPNNASPSEAPPNQPDSPADRAKTPVEIVSKKKVLTPFHVFRAIYQGRDSEFDFLTNAYMEHVDHTKKAELEQDGVATDGVAKQDELEEEDV